MAKSRKGTGSTLPRYVSITYDSAWNVKNEIPIGRMIWNSGGDTLMPMSLNVFTTEVAKNP